MGSYRSPAYPFFAGTLVLFLITTKVIILAKRDVQNGSLISLIRYTFSCFRKVYVTLSSTIILPQLRGLDWQSCQHTDYERPYDSPGMVRATIPASVTLYRALRAWVSDWWWREFCQFRRYGLGAFLSKARYMNHVSV